MEHNGVVFAIQNNGYESVMFHLLGFILSITIDEGFSVPRPGLEPGWTYMSEGF